MKSVNLTIADNKLITKGSIIGCAVSGGSDSMCLLHYLFNKSRQTGDFSVICVNVEHGIRGASSKKDTEFVKEYCLRHGIKFIGSSVNVPEYAKKQKKSIELSARELRYDFFYSLIDQGVCNRIAVAHNKEDNAESVLMHIFRGSSISGARSMRVSYRNIIRPLLNTDKREILHYLHQNDVPFILDESNKDNVYTRNFLRNVIIPQVEQRFTGVSDNVMRFSLIAGEEDDYLNQLASAALFSTDNGCGIKLPLDNVLLRRAAVMALQKLGIYSDYSYQNFSDIIKLSNLSPGARMDLGSGITVYREGGSLFFSGINAPSMGNESLPFSFGQLLFCGYKIDVEKATMPKDFSGALYFDADSIPQDSCFRFRQDGDIFKRYKGKTKLLSDYFADIGLPARLRDVCPLLCSGKNVLAVLPSDIGDSIKLTPKTKNIYKITFSGGAASELIQRCRGNTHNKGAVGKKD